MRIPEELLGKLVYVKFLDHAAFTKELCLCQVVGWIVEIGEKHVSIAWWDLLDEDDLETLEDNREHCSIIMSAIQELRIIELSTSSHLVPN